MNRRFDKTFGIAQLKAFNEWRDEILIEVSTVLLIIGFIMGTVDVFIGGGVATDIRFKIAWAIVQALSIDGLFFAVWGKVAKAQWTKANLKRTIPLVAVGVILAIVAALVNDILTYQQVNSLVNSIDAIKQLGIDVQTFTTSRAILVVGVGVLVQLFCRSDGTVESGTPVQIDAVQPSTAVQVNTAVQVSVQQPVQAVQQVDAVIEQPAQPALPERATVQPDRSEQRATVLELHKEHKTRREIAQTVGVPLSTVQSWIRQEVKDD